MYTKYEAGKLMCHIFANVSNEEFFYNRILKSGATFSLVFVFCVCYCEIRESTFPQICAGEGYQLTNCKS
jgi:hypothetical protein